MKKILLLSIILILGVTLNGQDLTNAKDYLEFIRVRHEKIQEELWDYVSTAAHSNRQGKIKRRRQDLIKELEKARDEIRQLPPLDGKTSLRDSMVLYLTRYDAMLKGDYADLDKLEKKADESYGAMLAYRKKNDEINDQLTIQSKHIAELYRQFAQDHNINLIERESRLSQKMLTTNLVMEYYDEIFLPQFRLTLYRKKLLEAIADNDTIKINKYEDSLKIAIDEGEKKLKNTTGYSGDYSLKFACQKTIQNSKLILNNYLPDIKKYYIARRNYDRQKAIVDRKGQNNLSQEEIDAFNKSVNEVNAAVTKYNSSYEKMRTLTEQDINQWNKAVDKFFDKHIPK